MNLRGFPEHFDRPRLSSLRGAEGSPESSTRCSHFIGKLHLLLSSSRDCHLTTGQQKMKGPGWHLAGWSIRHRPNSRGPRYLKEIHEVSHWRNVMLLHVVHIWSYLLYMILSQWIASTHIDTIWETIRRHFECKKNNRWTISDGPSTPWGHQTLPRAEKHFEHTKNTTRRASYADNLPGDRWYQRNCW